MFSKFASDLSLVQLDRPWAQTLDESMVAKPFVLMKRLVPSAVSNKGSILQQGSFVVALILLVALAMPQFADDKEILGLIPVFGFILWIAGYLLGGTERRQPSAIDALVLLYFAANVISTGASHYLAPSIRGLAKVAVYILTYFYMTSLMQQRPFRKCSMIGLLVAIGLLVSLYGFYQYHNHVEPLATWEDPTVENKGTRIFSTLKNPNLLAGYLLPQVALAAGLGMAAFSARRPLFGVPLMVIAAAIAVATLLTGSRGGYLGLFATGAAFVIVVAIMIWRERPKLRLPMIGVLIVGAAGGLLALHFVPGFEQRVTSIFAGSEHSSNAFRMNVWRSSFAMFKDNWWFGIGPGNQTFRLAYGLYMISGFDALGTYCVPLEVAVEAGLLGIISFAALIVCLLARAHIAFWNSSVHVSAWQRWLAVGAAAALAGMMVHGLVDTVFYRPQVQFIFWLIVSLLTTADLSASEPTQADQTTA